MKTKITLLLCLTIVSIYSQKKALPLFTSNLNLFTSQKITYKDFSDKIKDQNENVTDSRNKVFERAYYTDAFPMIRGNETQKWDYSEFNNNVLSNTITDYNGFTLKYNLIAETNKRLGTDLSTKIETLQSMVCLWILDKSNSNHSESEKEVLKQLYIDIQKIIEQKLGKGNEDMVNLDNLIASETVVIKKVSRWKNTTLTLRYNKVNKQYYLKFTTNNKD